MEKKRKDFKFRPGTKSEGDGYEVIMAAFFSLKFCMDTAIQNFEISSNDDNYKGYDDLVIEIDFKDHPKETFALQLKCGKIKGLGEYFKDKHDKGCVCIYFAQQVITDRRLAVERIDVIKDAEDAKTAMVNLFNTNQSQQYGAKKAIHQETKNETYLLLEQQNTKGVRQEIAKMLGDILNGQSDEIVNKFEGFFTNWAAGDYGGYKLDKSDIRLKLFELVFWNNICDFPAYECSSGTNNSSQFELLKRAFCNADITITTSTQNELIGKSLGSETKLDIKNEDAKSIIKNCLLPLNLKMTDKVRHFVRWRNKEIPLVLDLDKSDDITPESVSTFINIFSDAKHKLILVGEDIVNKIQTQFKEFRNLGDLIDMDGGTLMTNMIEQFTVSVQGRDAIKLGQLEETVVSLKKPGDDETELRKTFREAVNVEHLLRMVKGFHVIGRLDDSNQLSFYIPRKLTMETIETVKLINAIKTSHQSMIIYNAANTVIYDEIKKIAEIKVFSMETYLQEGKNEDEKQCIIFTEQPRSIEDLDKIYAINPKIIQLKIFNNTEVEVLYDPMHQLSGSSTNEVGEDKIVGTRFNGINIITGEAGMGKSTLIRNFTKNCPSNTWVCRIECQQYNKLFERQLTVKDIFKNFAKCDDVLADLLSKKLKPMFIFDGLDEIEPKNVENAMRCVTTLLNEDFCVWITGRYRLQDKLEETFKKSALHMTDITKKQQIEYITTQLNTYKEEQVQEIYKNQFVMQNRRIIGIPLHLYMLTEILKSDAELFNKIKENNFAITDLFKHFIHAKYLQYRKKMGIASDQHHFVTEELILSQYYRLGLTAVFNNNILDILGIDAIDTVESQGFKDYLGLMINSPNNSPTFAHQTYAEYLSACWLAKRICGPRIELKNRLFILMEQFDNVRLMLDILLSQDLPLHMAVIYENLQSVKENIKQIYKTDSFGRTALHLAASRGVKEANPVEWIRLSYYIIGDWNIRKEQIVSHHNKCKSIMENLVYASDSSTLQPDKLFNYTPTHYADHFQCFYILDVITSKYNINDIGDNLFTGRTDNYYDNALTHCASLDYFSFFKLILDVCDNSDKPIIQNERCVTPKSNSCLLTLVVQAGSSKICEFLGNLPAVNVNQKDEERGCTPLHFASIDANVTIVSLLVQVGADVNARDFHEKTPLIVAVENKRHLSGNVIVNARRNIKERLIVCKVLYENEAHLYAIDREQKSAMCYAIKNEYLDICKFLIEKGVNVNEKNESARTNLMDAASGGNLDLCQLLVNMGARISCHDKDGMTPMAHAARKGHLDICRFFIEKEADVKETYIDGRTILMDAASSGNLDFCKFLVDKGAEINCRDNNGKTPMSYAAEKGHLDICKFIFRNGANVNEKDKAGTTILMNAASSGNIDLCEFLVEKKAEVNCKNNNGNTLMAYAVEKGHVDICRFFIKKGVKM